MSKSTHICGKFGAACFDCSVCCIGEGVSEEISGRFFQKIKALISHRSLGVYAVAQQGRRIGLLCTKSVEGNVYAVLSRTISSKIAFWRGLQGCCATGWHNFCSVPGCGVPRSIFRPWRWLLSHRRLVRQAEGLLREKMVAPSATKPRAALIENTIRTLAHPAGEPASDHVLST